MVSDFAHHFDIVEYAKLNKVYYPSIFTEIYGMARKEKFRREDKINKSDSWNNRLAFIHTGAVMGRIRLSNSQKERHLLMDQEIFYCGNLPIANFNRVEEEWIALKSTEITSISLSYLIEILSDQDPGGQKIMQLIGEKFEKASTFYHSLAQTRNLEEKITYMLNYNPRFRWIMKKYLAELMGVNPYSLSRAMSKWAYTYLQ